MANNNPTYTGIAHSIRKQVRLLRENGNDVSRDRIKVVCVTASIIANDLKASIPAIDLCSFMDHCGFVREQDFRFYSKKDLHDIETVEAIL